MIDEILTRFELPPVDRALPSAFRARFGLGAVEQYGLVTGDLDAAVGALEAAGVGPFLRLRWPLRRWYERGVRKPYRVHLALARVDGLEIEVIGPGAGTDFHQRSVQPGRLLTLQHVALRPDDLEAAGGALEGAGYPGVVRAAIDLGFADLRVAYHDTRDELDGVYLELTRLRLLGRPLHPSPAVLSLAARAQRAVARLLRRASA